jgi:hypothetical protein
MARPLPSDSDILQPPVVYEYCLNETVALLWWRHLFWVEFWEQARALRLLVFRSAVYSMMDCAVSRLQDKDSMTIPIPQLRFSSFLNVQPVNVIS